MGMSVVEGPPDGLAAAAALPLTRSALTGSANRQILLRDGRVGLHGGHPTAPPAEPEEPRFVRGVMVALLPAGLLWLGVISVFRLMLG
jgi:hypothetical protein